MHRTFLDENSRKEKLFKEWDQYLCKVHSQFVESDFDEIYEGMSTISGVAEKISV